MNRPKKNKEQRKDALLEMMLKEKPEGGEDFWVFSMIRDDARPTWEIRYSTVGTYEQCARDMVAMTHVMMAKNMLHGVKIASYQGDDARNYLLETEIEEARYQQERRNQPNN